MARLPDLMMVHEVTVEPWAGAGATGDVFEAPVPIACFVERKRKLVRAADGTETVSESRVFAQLDALAEVPARSRVTFATGQQTKVIQAHRRDAPGLPVPEHWELVCE